VPTSQTNSSPPSPAPGSASPEEKRKREMGSENVWGIEMGKKMKKIIKL
jgi:hypothetical protein